ncbi:hypothetical protein [Burkholderia multivorans]|uniref:hypothetical protein n=1 Tax=Burkholderia multivorans TaxID=87883 RepID=UPI0019CF9E0A|nr:hypothetical protein [Burkholderia multivorans]MBN6728339.1 hypothetical protein [Burkholderia multivorans]MBN6737955.1 hypothetical protein [Burkholderia multivorans]MBN8162726.1 hypothetical protein [Burkholderia multivorans]MBN8169892.1 hypothetical protein [Burkholderia multivorans]MBN8179128.1 hypothetical protein [Burkholderia multivorans]
MDTANVSAVISAAAGISGVLLGNSFVAVKEWLTNRSKRQKETAYLAIIVVSHLDRFANGCLHVALDDGTEDGRPAGRNEEEYTPTTTPPDFQPLDIDVEWKVLPRDLMYAILRLPDEKEKVQNTLAGIAEYDDDYPDHTEYFWARRSAYAELGLQASRLATRLRRHGGMPLEQPEPGEWSRDKELLDVLKEIDDKRDAHRRRLAEKAIKRAADAQTGTEPV